MSGVIVISSPSEFDKYCYSTTGKPAVVDFTATWCGPCRIMAPVFEQLSIKYRGIHFLKVDVDMDTLDVIVRQCNVSAMPTFVIFFQGKQRETLTGADPTGLEQLLQKYKNMQAAFSGVGNKLSSVTKPVQNASSSVPEPQPTEVEVDESQPTTMIQIRTAAGARIVAKFNISNTVADLKNHIRKVNQGGPTTFSLLSGGPPAKIITCEDSTTLQDAGLTGSVVIQKA